MKRKFEEIPENYKISNFTFGCSHTKLNGRKQRKKTKIIKEINSNLMSGKFLNFSLSLARPSGERFSLKH